MNTAPDPSTPLISNGFVTCYSDYFVIHLYYFPFGNKKVKYSNIRSCELRSTDGLDVFNHKLWGMALSPVWWHCDMKRFGRKQYILLNANQWPQIGLTMDDADLLDVYDLIKKKMLEKPAHTSSHTVSEKTME